MMIMAHELINQSLADSAIHELALTPALSPRRGGIAVRFLERQRIAATPACVNRKSKT
jgi:hypothetical protein